MDVSEPLETLNRDVKRHIILLVFCSIYARELYKCCFFSISLKGREAVLLIIV